MLLAGKSDEEASRIACATRSLIKINAPVSSCELAFTFPKAFAAKRVTDMISLEDCIGLCGLDEEQVAAIAEHEHIPEIAATALANYLITHPHGGERIRGMIVDDIHKALDDGRVKHASELFMALRHFLDQHPEARAGLAAGEM